MKAEEIRRGQCGCGAVNFTVRGDPILTNNCYCLQCQRQTGSTSIINASFEAERVNLLKGKLRETRLRTGSGGEQIVCSCMKCGVAVWSHYPRTGRKTMAVRLGALVDPAGIIPDACIFVSEKLSWVMLPEGIPAFESGYDYREVLPPARYARLEVLLT